MADAADQAGPKAVDQRGARGARTIQCSRCGASFGCINDGSDRCWCGAEAFKLPVPLPENYGPFDDCLCPTCIRAVAAELTALGHGPKGTNPGG